MLPIWQRASQMTEAVHPIEAYRKRSNPPLAKAAVAEDIGVARSTITRWERRERRPDDRYLPKLIELTGATVAELIGLPGENA
jgi:transcriptional regulator with XRE-family HTH domain